MKLSIVIVNYNVRHFLEQCLISVARACANIQAEVFVVDNASSDVSVEMVREKFPSVKVIANTNNVGFSKANNQAIEKATGEFVVLLNPDTVVAEDTFEKCIAFMNAHAEAGAIGVRMIDGKGNFLPESKRGLPTPAVAFYKTFGLAKLFPQSKTFGRYHLGFLNEHETHEADVLSGAYMFVRKEVLNKTGLLDETFFMYGEDIDLSYRITQAGYRNYYFADTTIIHYKGESTKKGSLNYVKVFYNAMLIFSRKHFSGNQSGLFSVLINFAIVFRGLLTLLANVFASSYLFVVDALLSFAGIYFIKTYWEDMIKYSKDYYPTEFLFLVVPLYILLWIAATFLSGGYDKPFRTSRVFRGIVLGTVAIAVLYAFIPDAWRFSRAIILLGAAWTGFEMLVTRSVYNLINYQSLWTEKEEEIRPLIAGKNETARAETVLRSLGYLPQAALVTDLNELKKAKAISQVNEIVFCSADFSFKEIIARIEECRNGVSFKILNQGSDALIGSNSKNSAGDLYVAEKTYALFKPENLRSKRVFDFGFSVLLLLLLPLNIFLIKNFGKFMANWLEVFTGKKSWVGFAAERNLQVFALSKKGVLHPADRVKNFALNDKEIQEAELSYAKNYSVADDVNLVWRNYQQLGR